MTGGQSSRSKDDQQGSKLPGPDDMDIVFVMEKNSVARLLTQFRQERGLSKAELAERTGMNPSSITRLEQGIRDPERETVLQLAEAMMLPLADRDRLLAAGGYRSEIWDDPLLIELVQLMAEPAIPPEARQEARSVVRMAIAYLKLRRLHDS